MCKGMDDPPAESTPVFPVFLQGIGHVIPLHSTGCWTLNEEHPAAGWLSGHYCPELNRIAEVKLLQACIQFMIDGILGCSPEDSGPGQPQADLACVASRSLVKTCGTVL